MRERESGGREGGREVFENSGLMTTYPSEEELREKSPSLRNDKIEWEEELRRKRTLRYVSRRTRVRPLGEHAGDGWGGGVDAFWGAAGCV